MQNAREKGKRRWIESKTELDKKICEQGRNMFFNTIEAGRCKCLSNLVSECELGPREATPCCCIFTGDMKTSSLADHRDPHFLANEFFIKKMEKIQENIDDICEFEAIETNNMQLPNQSCVVLSEFDVLSAEDVRNFIMKSARKYCHLHPAPT